MLRIALCLFLGIATASAQDKLLDKIVAVINGRVFSLSELARVEATLSARKEISPFIYSQKNYDRAALLELMIRSYIIRDKISVQGYVISDDAVEGRIRMTEEKLGLTREHLLGFLRSKAITYDEYFEVTREAMEYQGFASRIIEPLVTITEQELKNEFYKRHATDKALSFTYSVVDFSVPEEQGKGKRKKLFVNALKDYQLTGRLGEGFSDLEANPLDGIKEDGLNKQIAEALSKTPEGGFTEGVVIGGRLRSFYIKKKDLVESQLFINSKQRLGEEIASEKSVSLTRGWFEREYPNYYIKKLL